MIEIEKEKLLKLRQSVFSLVCQDAGRIHRKIIEFFGDDSDIEGYLNLLKASIELYKDKDLRSDG